jgi:hypothetical protein
VLAVQVVPGVGAVLAEKTAAVLAALAGLQVVPLEVRMAAAAEAVTRQLLTAELKTAVLVAAELLELFIHFLALLALSRRQIQEICNGAFYSDC